jgi:hypothetical protein
MESIPNHGRPRTISKAVNYSFMSGSSRATAFIFFILIYFYKLGNILEGSVTGQHKNLADREQNKTETRRFKKKSC